MAQTLTDANSIPVVGHAETRTYHNSSSATTWATSGTGNSWDATAVTPFGITATIAYRAPGDSPFAASYPSTTLCAERLQGAPPSEWRHYVVDNAQAEMIGVSGEAVVGGRTYCTFPFSMGSTFTDSWTINGNNFSDTYTYVATGTVQAPWGAIPDVVMFQTSGGFSYYLYMASNLLDPIGTYTPGFGIDLWQVDLGTGITDVPQVVPGLWPNPANNAVNVMYPGSTAFQCTVVDASGRSLMIDKTTSGSLALDLTRLSSGVYTIVVIDDLGRRGVARLVVE